MVKKIIIFGAGQWGRMAYYYYADKCEIECFIDNSPELWGEKINGINVCEPQILKDANLQDIRIVIASKWQSGQIMEQLYAWFGITEYIIFSVETFIEEYAVPDEADNTEDECIISYMGGLGNQMFQYALAKCLIVKGRCVTGDISSYHQILAPDFILENVFSAISIRKCNIPLKKQYKKIRNLCFIQPDIQTVDKIEADISILEVERGYFKGYWQSAQFAGLVEKELRRDFKFSERKEDKLYRLSERIIGTGNTVSLHIRRGDYLKRGNREYYGNICTDDYYENAIEYMNHYVKDPVFYFFSNDIKWVKEKYGHLNAVYVSEELFDHYEDWYDMFLMSCCKHNIIANSTFSWWGAWLNSNQNKIVVAPSKWINDCDYRDIYPKSWIKMPICL